MTAFNKPARSVPELIQQWESRGLRIDEHARTAHYLSVISYYRLSSYTQPFQVGSPDHCFVTGASFDDVLALYVFDRELRLLLLDAIERIEVALRASMTNILTLQHGPHAYTDPTLFDTRYNHKWLLDQIRKKCTERNAEPFLNHYKSKYSSPDLPPTWMAMEVLTFKEVSVLLSKLRQTRDTQELARFWGLHQTVLGSWFRSLSDLRNTCAHHARVWNREFGSYPSRPKKPPARWPDLTRPLIDPTIDPTRRLYYQAVVIETLLQVVNPGSSWHKRLRVLIEETPQAHLTRMGFPADWTQDPFWRFTPERNP